MGVRVGGRSGSSQLGVTDAVRDQLELQGARDFLVELELSAQRCR